MAAVNKTKKKNTDYCFRIEETTVDDFNIQKNKGSDEWSQVAHKGSHSSQVIY